MPPSVGNALGAAFGAVLREAWLPVLGLGVALLRGLLSLPGSAFVVAVAWIAARGTLRGRGHAPDVVAVLAHAWANPRFRSLALGLWLAGILLWWAVRVAWVSGAVPILAWRISGARSEVPRLEDGVAYRFHKVLPAAVVSLLLDLAGRVLVLGAVLGAVAVGKVAQGSRSPGAVALVAAAALVSSLFLAASLSTLGDVAVARASMAGERPLAALGNGLRSFLSRPAAFLAAVLAIGIAGVLVAGSAQGVLGTVGVVARGGARGLAAFPQAMLAAAAALLVAATELWRLAALGVLSLAAQPGLENRWTSLRRESFGMRPPSQ